MRALLFAPLLALAVAAPAQEESAQDWDLAAAHVPQAWAKTKGGDRRVCIVWDDAEGAAARAVARVAPEADIRSYPHERSDAATPANIAAGIVWCTAREADVIEVSAVALARGTLNDEDQLIEHTVGDAHARGSVVVMPAVGKAKALGPLGADRKVVFVTALDARGAYASGSANGFTGVSFIAPAAGAEGKSPAGGDAATVSASAHVAGLAALYFALHPAASPNDVYRALRDAARPLNAPAAPKDRLPPDAGGGSFLPGEQQGWGLIDACALLGFSCR